MDCKICGSVLLTRYKNMFDDRHGYPGKFKILECLNCGFLQTDPQLPSEKLTYVYTNYYPKRDANIKDIVNSSKNIPARKEIFKNGWDTTCHYQTKKGQKVLDIGCGTCQSLLEIKQLGGKAWGIDPDKNSQKVAKKLKLNFQLGTLHTAKLPINYFDLITASQVLEHEENPILFLTECKKYLKKNGEIVLSFPNTGSLFNKLWGKHWLHWHIPYHLNHFNKKSLQLLADKADLKIKSMKTVTPNLWIVLQIRSYLAKPRHNIRNIMWDGKTVNNKQVKQTKRDKILSLLLANSHIFLQFNRIIDYFGLGESFVVNLSAN